MSLIVLGSVALDTIETERGKVEEYLGGSASHAALAAAYFTRPNLIGVVGDDFPVEYEQFLAERIDLSELEVLPGKTFRWHGIHSLKHGTTEHKATALNTYEQYKPTLSPQSARASHVLLGNIDPELQLYVLDQLSSPGFVVCDTMTLWINNAKEKVLEVMRRVDLFLLNQEESFQLTGEEDVRAAGQQLLTWGASQVLIKCGPHPAQLFGREGVRQIPTVRGVDLVDPTGAGDAFAGALMGYMVSHDATAGDEEVLTQAVRYGAAVASFVIEAFGTNAHHRLGMIDIDRRVEALAQAG